MASSARILLITGGDDYSAELAVKRRIEEFVPADLRKSAVEVIDGSASNAELQLASIRSCIASIQTPPFLDPVKLTWWKGVTFLPGGGHNGKISEEVKDALERFATMLSESPVPDNQMLVITAVTLLKTSVFAKKMAKIAEVIEFAVADKSYARNATALARLPELAKEAGVEFESGADRAFVAKTGPDTRTIVSELAKMRTYLGDEKRKVTAADVAEITSAGSDEVEIWSLTDAMLTHNHSRVLSALANFQGDKGWPIKISTILAKWFGELLVAKAGGGGNDWKSRKAAESAAKFEFNELRNARWRMLKLRESLTSSNVSPAFAEMEILRTISRDAKS